MLHCLMELLAKVLQSLILCLGQAQSIADVANVIHGPQFGNSGGHHHAEQVDEERALLT